MHLVLMIFFFIPNHSYSKDCAHTNKIFKCAKYVKNYDGDTINFKIKDVHPYFGNKFKVRLAGIDTPEKRTKDKCEKEKARQAQKLVENLLKNAKTINIEPLKLDKWGRHLSYVFFDNKNLNEILVKNKLAYRYYGKRKPAFDWCK